MTYRSDSEHGGRRTPAAVATVAALALAGVTLIALALIGLQPGDPPAPPAPAAHANGADRPATPGPSGHPSRATASADTPDRLLLPRTRPVALRIPALATRSEMLVPLGLRPDGSIEVPSDPERVGWYTHGPWPGQPGPAVVVGHVDSDSGPAVFYRLGDMRVGDTIKVVRADGATAVFTVDTVQQHPKDDFPTSRVYGPTHGRAELRLVTCGGDFSNETQHYRQNTIVYASLTDVHTTERVVQRRRPRP